MHVLSFFCFSYQGDNLGYYIIITKRLPLSRQGCRSHKIPYYPFKLPAFRNHASTRPTTASYTPAPLREVEGIENNRVQDALNLTQRRKKERLNYTISPTQVKGKIGNPALLIWPQFFKRRVLTGFYTRYRVHSKGCLKSGALGRRTAYQ